MIEDFTGERGRAAADYADLLRRAREANPDVQDVFDEAALLESMGISDRFAETAYGYPTVFDLAEAVLRDITTGVRVDVRPRPASEPLRRRLWAIARSTVHGMAFALPMVLSIVSMITLHVSLTSYQYFSLQQATALALATFMSFLVTGGFTQVMAYTYYLLVGTEAPALTESILWLMMRVSLGLTVLLGISLLLVDGLFPLLPFGTMAFTVLYLVPLAALWLAFATLYVLRHESILTLLTAAGITVVFALWRLGLPVALAQVIGIATDALLATGLSIAIFRRASRSAPHAKRAIETRIAHLAHASSPYFVYGIVYFAFIFTDRLVAWTTGTGLLPFGVWFRGPYELGMDWALGALVLPLGVSESFLTRLLGYLSEAPQRTPIGRFGAFVREARGRYVLTILGFLLVALSGWALLQGLVGAAHDVPLLTASLPDRLSEPFVFHWASIAYVGLALGLFNVLLLFSLARPLPALRSFAAAITVDLGVGLLVTRTTGSYTDAVFGLAAGVLYLVVSTTRSLLALFPRLDHTLFELT